MDCSFFGFTYNKHIVLQIKRPLPRTIENTIYFILQTLIARSQPIGVGGVIGQRFPFVFTILGRSKRRQEELLLWIDKSVNYFCTISLKSVIFFMNINEVCFICLFKRNYLHVPRWFV